MTSYRTWLFSGGWPRFDGWPAKNVHTDLAFAQQSGLPTRAASGAMMQGYLYELMVDLFGEGWLERGQLSLKFIRIVDVGDTIGPRERGCPDGARRRARRDSTCRCGARISAGSTSWSAPERAGWLEWLVSPTLPPTRVGFLCRGGVDLPPGPLYVRRW